MSFYHPTTIAKGCIRGREVVMSHMYTSFVALLKKLRSKSYVIINNEPSDKKTSLSSLTAFKDTHDQVSTSHEKKLCWGSEKWAKLWSDKRFSKRLAAKQTLGNYGPDAVKNLFSPEKKRKPKTALIIWRLDCKLSGCLKKKKNKAGRNT